MDAAVPTMVAGEIQAAVPAAAEERTEMTEDQETIPAETILAEKIPAEIEDSIPSLHRAALVDVKKSLFNNRLLHIVRHSLTNQGTDAKLKPMLKSTA